MTNQHILGKNPSSNISFEQDRHNLLWLNMLINAYEIIDEGVRVAIKKQKKKKLELSCNKGCANCCKTHKDIPVYPLELSGIYWFSIEKIQDNNRHILKTQLRNHKKPHCPFLIDESCSIYPVRPIACRQFNVFRKKCEKGEDPYHTRKDDVLVPIKDYTEKAFYVMLPFYGIINEKDRLLAIKNKLIHAHAQNLHSINWIQLANRMDDYDYKKI